MGAHIRQKEHECGEGESRPGIPWAKVGLSDRKSAEYLKNGGRIYPLKLVLDAEEFAHQSLRGALCLHI